MDLISCDRRCPDLGWRDGTTCSRSSLSRILRPLRPQVLGGSQAQEMKRVNVLVLGAGPSGSTAALRLAAEGAEVMLVDKAIFPRDKPCGGGLAVRAVRELPVSPDPVVEHVVDRIGFRLFY